MQFLTDEWLVDVQTDYAGKCVLIALALSIIERELLGERPGFFITAGKRGGGKTTAATMVALAVTGRRPAASAWSPNEEERQKSIFAALLQSLPIVVFDNIKLGTAIACPHVEKALTGAEFEDRVLGESRRERAPCSTILVFTGNNITAKGDLASRVLAVRISVDRPDPENRNFRHPDPVAWTLDHRGQIIEALYTILLGNPRLRQRFRDRVTAKTRFKQWWHLVGSAIEHAADLCGKTVDFGRMFQDIESQDEEAASFADVMQCIVRLLAKPTFRTADISKWMQGDGDDAATLKNFFVGRKGLPSAQSINWKLKAHLDAPTWVGEEIWTLRSETVPHAKETVFHIDKRRGHGETGETGETFQPPDKFVSLENSRADAPDVSPISPVSPEASREPPGRQPWRCRL